MDKFYCHICGQDISDCPARCSKCGHGYSYRFDLPPLGFWASFWRSFRWFFGVPVGILVVLGLMM